MKFQSVKVSLELYDLVSCVPVDKEYASDDFIIRV